MTAAMPYFIYWRDLHLTDLPIRERGKANCGTVAVELHSVVATFCYATMTEIVMRVSEAEKPHERHHMAKSSGQSGRQHERPRGWGSQGTEQ